MRYIRFKTDRPQWGILDGKNITVLDGDFLRGGRPTQQILSLDQVELLTPVQPSKIVCIGLNYRDHAAEMHLKLPEEPIIFLKPPTSLLQPEGAIAYPNMSRQVDYEAELAIVIGQQVSQVTEQDSAKYIFGYTCANDVTARDLQSKDGQWTRAKSFDTFLPLGPWVETEVNPANLEITLSLNGIVKQHSNTSNLIFPVNYLVSFVSQVMTLEPGDVILTGTPHGVGPMQPGDRVSVLIENLGELANIVRKK